MGRGKGQRERYSRGQKVEKSKRARSPSQSIEKCRRERNCQHISGKQKATFKRFLKHFWITESPSFFSSESKVQSSLYLLQEKNFILSADESTRGLKQFVFERIGFQCEEVSEDWENGVVLKKVWTRASQERVNPDTTNMSEVNWEELHLLTWPAVQQPAAA